MKITYIYALIDPRTNEIRYVGKSDNPEKRYGNHIKCYGNNKYKINWIKQLLELNLHPFLIVLEECAEENWEKRERYWIKYYKDQGHKLTNLTEGGEGIGSEYLLKRYEDPEERRKTGEYIKKAYENNPELGKRTSERMTGENNTMYGKQHTKESIMLISMNHADVSGENNPMFGKKQSDVQRKKASEANKGKKPWNKGKKTGALSEEIKAKMRKPHNTKRKRERKAKENENNENTDLRSGISGM